MYVYDVIIYILCKCIFLYTINPFCWRFFCVLMDDLYNIFFLAFGSFPIGPWCVPCSSLPWLCWQLFLDLRRSKRRGSVRSWMNFFSHRDCWFDWGSQSFRTDHWHLVFMYKKSTEPPCWHVNTFNISIDVVDCMALLVVPKESVSKAFKLKFACESWPSFHPPPPSNHPYHGLQPM